MPLHLGSFVERRKDKKVFSEVLALCAKAHNPISSDGEHFHTDYPLIDKKKKKIGKIVFTFNVVDGHLNLIDADITIIPSKSTKLIFEHKLPKSSEANEYYDVVCDDLHFQVETVNRYSIKGDIEGTTQAAWLSAFPFRINVYDNIESFNEETGLKGIKTKTGQIVHGFSEQFMCPNMAENSEDDPYTFMLGKVKDIEDIELKINKRTVDFKIIYLETGVDIIPAVVSDKVFDLSNVKKGKLIAMNADIKADFRE